MPFIAKYNTHPNDPLTTNLFCQLRLTPHSQQTHHVNVHSVYAFTLFLSRRIMLKWDVHVSGTMRLGTAKVESAVIITQCVEQAAYASHIRLSMNIIT